MSVWLMHVCVFCPTTQICQAGSHQTFIVFSTCLPCPALPPEDFGGMGRGEVSEGVDEGVGERWVSNESTPLSYKMSGWSLTVAYTQRSAEVRSFLLSISLPSLLIGFYLFHHLTIIFTVTPDLSPFQQCLWWCLILSCFVCLLVY